jgi:hypothetical protein
VVIHSVYAYMQYFHIYCIFTLLNRRNLSHFWVGFRGGCHQIYTRSPLLTPKLRRHLKLHLMKCWWHQTHSKPISITRKQYHSPCSHMATKPKTTLKHTFALWHQITDDIYTHPAAMLMTMYPQARGSETRVKSAAKMMVTTQGGSCSVHSRTACT